MEDISQRIGNLPFLCQHGLQVEVLISAQQRIEQQLANTLRLRVNPNPWIEVRRTALDDHDGSVGIRLVSTSVQGEEQKQQPNAPQQPARGFRTKHLAPRTFLTHTTPCRESPAAWPLLPKEYCPAVVATSGMQAGQRPPLLSRPPVGLGLPSSAPATSSAQVVLRSSASGWGSLRRRPIRDSRDTSRASSPSRPKSRSFVPSTPSQSPACLP